MSESSYVPSNELLKSMGFYAIMKETYMWKGSPMLLYLGSMLLLNKDTNVSVTLRATSDKELLGELVGYGWLPAMP